MASKSRSSSSHQ
ncbi:BnaCnng08050D [Brassica napus]|uniref:BnaCnng08050D protein n=1 Tax=Brassica napus TaxID=3708 RepID=A0A078HHN3_BRANA|nr:BnaCnng08050D [Brassica napus]